MIDFNPYKDKWGMMAPSYNATDSGNGLFYTAVANLSAAHASSMIPFAFNSKFGMCFQDGVLYRTPDRAYGKESFDNYLGCVLGFMVSGMNYNAKLLLWSAVRKCFYVDGNFIGRFLPVWILLPCVAYPWLTWPMAPLLCLLALFQKPVSVKGNGSALQLQLVVMSCVNQMLPRLEIYEGWRAKLLEYAPRGEVEIFEEYYGKIHPITECWK